MSKTTFSSKCRILGDFWLDYREDAKSDENWQEFFEWADIGLPLAFHVDRGYVDNPSSLGIEMIENTWNVFCEMCSVDPDGDYINLVDVFDASPNDRIQ